ncbi:hypothetical protein VTK73DRAFT_8657 [Phialemonium thermophilum]|uniref:Nephrocystin 3-like N-terminal domain-containing protein n=1 Tax=Phialemonium thermophilum TaxID=223376 RepID=A0ABR3XPB3_9PEZI
MIVRSLELESEGADGIACIYIYFQSGAEHQASFTSILICLLRQLFQRRQSIELLEALRSMCKDWWELHKPPRSEAFVQLFRDGLATFQTVYLVLDALDNCQNSPVEPTRDRLHEEIRTLPPNVMILVTSRDGWQVGRDLGADRELRITPQRSDVENYVRSRIKNHDILRREVARSDGIRFEQSIVGVVTRAALSSSMYVPPLRPFRPNMLFFFSRGF